MAIQYEGRVFRDDLGRCLGVRVWGMHGGIAQDEYIEVGFRDNHEGLTAARRCLQAELQRLRDGQWRRGLEQMRKAA